LRNGENPGEGGRDNEPKGHGQVFGDLPDDPRPTKHTKNQNWPQGHLHKGRIEQVACRQHGKDEKGRGVNKAEAQAVAAKLHKNIDGIRYGTVAVTLTLHDGRIVEVTYSRNERNRDGVILNEHEGEEHE